MSRDRLMKQHKKFSGNLTINSKAVGKTAEGENFVIIRGMANAYTNENGQVVVDRDDEIILPDAYELDNFLKNPIALYQHNWDTPIGKVTQVNVTDKGLEVEVQVFESMHKEAYVGISNGVLKAFSIGFMYKEGRWQDPMSETNYTWVWTKVELYEVSIVSIPANQDSIFTIANTNTPCSGEGVCTMGNQPATTPEPLAIPTGDQVTSPKATTPRATKSAEGGEGETSAEPTSEPQTEPTSEPQTEPQEPVEVEPEAEQEPPEEPTAEPGVEPEQDTEPQEPEAEPTLIEVFAKLQGDIPDVLEDDEALAEAYNLYTRLASVINASL